MSTKTEGIIRVLAAILVLFTAMLDPRVSAGIAVVALLALGVYNLRFRDS